MAAGTNTGMEVPGSNVVMGTEVLVSNVVMGTEVQVSNVVMGTEVLVSGAGMGVVVPVRVAGTNASTLSEADTAIIVDRVTRNLQSPAAGGTPACPASLEGKLYPKTSGNSSGRRRSLPYAHSDLTELDQMVQFYIKSALAPSTKHT